MTGPDGKELTMNETRETRKCRCALTTGCRRCRYGYHHAECARDAAERRLRKAAARQRARREGETR